MTDPTGLLQTGFRYAGDDYLRSWLVEVANEKIPVLNLNLSSSCVTDVGVWALAEQCPELVSIHLSCSEVTDAGIQTLANRCPQLREIHLLDTIVTDVGVQALAVHCPHPVVSAIC